MYIIIDLSFLLCFMHVCRTTKYFVPGTPGHLLCSFTLVNPGTYFFLLFSTFSLPLTDSYMYTKYVGMHICVRLLPPSPPTITPVDAPSPHHHHTHAGMAVKGGSDTPYKKVYVRELRPGGAVYKDGFIQVCAPLHI